MIKISHRGNVTGRQPNDENRESYIKEALRLGYDVEVDVWKAPGGYYLGHDKPEFRTSLNFLCSHAENFWVHCKNIEALADLTGTLLNCFFHQNDDVTLTSKGFLWVYPGKPLVPGAICVMPEYNNQKPTAEECGGVCSDLIKDYSS